MATYRKSRAFAPEGFFECEGRGLEWLGAAHAQGGPRVVQVYGWGKDYLDIDVWAARPPRLRRHELLVRLWPICMMWVPNISGLRLTDITAHAISDHCRTQ